LYRADKLEYGFRRRFRQNNLELTRATLQSFITTNNKTNNYAGVYNPSNTVEVLQND
jgi:hypothetical protein